MKYRVIRYQGNPREIGSKFKIELDQGDLVAITPEGEVIIGNVSKKVTKEDMNTIFGCFEEVGFIEQSMYGNFYQKDLARKHNMPEHEELPMNKITSAHFTHNIDRYAGEVLNSESKNNIISVAGHPVIIKRH